MRTIKTFEPCEQCRGTGLEHIPHTIDCRRCQGYGKNLVSMRKEVIDRGEKPERYGR